MDTQTRSTGSVDWWRLHAATSGAVRRARHSTAVSERTRSTPSLRARSLARPDQDALEPLVLIHPFAACPDVWKPILSFLQRKHEVISLSIPGHLGADPIPDGFGHTVAEAVDLLEMKLDALGIERAHLVGNSLGGWLAIELARRGRALSVVALAPGGGWELGSREHRRLLRKFQVTKTLLSVGGPLAALLARSSISRGLVLRDAVARPERLTPLEATGFIEAAWRCAIFSGVLKALPTQPLSEPFEGMPCPVRLVWGEKDRLLPIRGYSERWRRVLPGAEWLVLRDVGHVPMYDDPDAVADSILQFTARVSDDGANAADDQRLAG